MEKKYLLLIGVSLLCFVSAWLYSYVDSRQPIVLKFYVTIQSYDVTLHFTEGTIENLRLLSVMRQTDSGKMKDVFDLEISVVAGDNLTLKGALTAIDYIHSPTMLTLYFQLPNEDNIREFSFKVAETEFAIKKPVGA